MVAPPIMPGPIAPPIVTMGPALPDPIWARATPASTPTTDPAGTPVATALITGEKAKELAIQYTEKYLKGFTVKRVLLF